MPSSFRATCRGPNSNAAKHPQIGRGGVSRRDMAATSHPAHPASQSVLGVLNLPPGALPANPLPPPQIPGTTRGFGMCKSKAWGCGIYALRKRNHGTSGRWNRTQHPKTPSSAVTPPLPYSFRAQTDMSMPWPRLQEPASGNGRSSAALMIDDRWRALAIANAATLAASDSKALLLKAEWARDSWRGNFQAK